MRIFRIITAALLLVLIGAGGTAWYALHNQARLVAIALTAINQRTGLNITPANSRLIFRNHLVVLLEHPRVTMGGREVARLADIRAVVSYHALIYRNGLPLYALILDRAGLQVPKNATDISVAGLPRLDVKTVTMLKRWLDAVSDIIQRVEVIDSSLADADGKPLVAHLNLMAFREHRKPGKWPWLLNFDAEWQPAPLSKMRISGSTRMGAHADERDLVATGRVWFWGLELSGINVAQVEVAGKVQGGLRLVLHEDGGLNGSGDLEIRQLTLSGKALNRPIALGDCTFNGSYTATATRLDLVDLTLRQGQSQLLEARASVLEPYEKFRTVVLTGGGVKLALPSIAGWLHAIRGASSTLTQMAERIRSGEFTISELSLDSATPVENWTIATLRQNLRAHVALNDFGYTPAPESGLPAVARLDADLAYAGGKFSIRQGSAEIGASSVSDLNLDADLSRAPRAITYKARLVADADASEVYRLARDVAERAEPRLRGQIQWVRGQTEVTATAFGVLTDWNTPTMPDDYALRIETSGVQFLATKSPSAIALKSGIVNLKPGTIEFDKVVAAPIESTNSSIVINGTIAEQPRFPSLRNVAVELHGIEAEKWLPLMVDPEQLAAKGPVGGRLELDSQAGTPMPKITGKLTLGPGDLQLGFLRSPMILESATLTFDGKGLALDLPSSRLEGSPLEFKLTLADFAQPQMRIDAKAAKLDFEVMRFIRLPWSPRTPPHFFPVPVVGHIQAAAANFDKLAMMDISTDFMHNDTDWAVQNFTARAFEGRADLNITGRARDDWIHINGRLLGLNAASLFTLSGKIKHSPILGRLYATGDLWANTDVDFFNTLAGSAAINVVDGTLDKFTLLTRVLGLLDLKNWITAQIPDPRSVGIPFKNLSATFKGERGDFYTDDLRVEGPVMDITARGDIQFGDGSMNMELSLIPFNTANWIVKQIPIIGNNLASGSQGLVAAYFHVSGPVSDPKVTPKPITSVAEFVIKTLSLPINILAPHTIK